MAAAQALKQHYDGFVDLYKHIQASKHNDENIFYKVETLFYFEYYCTAITENYKGLEQYRVPYYEVDKAKLFLDGIKNSNQLIQMAITSCESNALLSNTLEKYTTYMSKEVSRIYTSSNSGAIKFRTRNIHGIFRGIGGCIGGSGHCIVRVGCHVTQNNNISNYVDGKKTYVPRKVWIQLGITSESNIFYSEQGQAEIKNNRNDSGETSSVASVITLST